MPYEIHDSLNCKFYLTVTGQNYQNQTTADQFNVELEMWASAQRDGRPAEYRWRPLFNAAKFG